MEPLKNGDLFFQIERQTLDHKTYSTVLWKSDIVFHMARGSGH